MLSTRWFLVPAVLFVLGEFAIFFAFTGPQLSDEERQQRIRAGHQLDNRLGQDESAVFVYALGLLGVIYGLRATILMKSGDPWTALAWYIVLVLAAIPYIWVFVSMDWNNRFAGDEAYWVSEPIRMLFVPTFFFFFLNVSTATPRQVTQNRLLVLSAVELFIVFPLWAFLLWPVLAIFVFGLYWI